jgi:hypothetical protein
MTMPGTHTTERIQRLRARIAQAQTTLRREQRKQQRRLQAARNQRLLVYGELAAHARLETELPDVMLGLLLSGAAQIDDPAMRGRWQTLGAQVLAHDTRLQRTLQRLEDVSSDVQDMASDPTEPPRV